MTLGNSAWDETSGTRMSADINPYRSDAYESDRNGVLQVEVASAAVAVAEAAASVLSKLCLGRIQSNSAVGLTIVTLC